MNALRQLLNEGRRGAQFVGAPSALFGRLIARHGFDGVYCSGAVLSTSVHAVPDDGTLTLDQVGRFAGEVCGATALPVICDADTGFSDEADISECIRRMEAAGVAGIQLEDQISAKKCGHLEGKQLVSTALMCEKLRCAVKTRRDAATVLIARTDARGVTGWDDALERAHAYRAAGADMIFIEALHDGAEFQRFAELCPGALMANMTEFGKSALIGQQELASFGYSVIIYPATLFRLMLGVADQALSALKRDGHQKALVPDMWSRQALYDLVGYEQAVPEWPAADNSVSAGAESGTGSTSLGAPKTGSGD